MKPQTCCDERQHGECTPMNADFLATKNTKLQKAQKNFCHELTLIYTNKSDLIFYI